MRRNSRILLLFGIIWFSGVYLYVRNSDNSSGVYKAESNPRHGNRVSKDASEKRKCLLLKSRKSIQFLDHKKEKHKPNSPIHKENEKIDAEKLEHDIEDIEHGIEDLQNDGKKDEFAAIEDSIRHDLEGGKDQDYGDIEGISDNDDEDGDESESDESKAHADPTGDTKINKEIEEGIENVEFEQDELQGPPTEKPVQGMG